MTMEERARFLVHQMSPCGSPCRVMDKASCGCFADALETLTDARNEGLERAAQWHDEQEGVERLLAEQHAVSGGYTNAARAQERATEHRLSAIAIRKGIATGQSEQSHG